MGKIGKDCGTGRKLMIKYTSTRNKDIAVDSTHAVLEGIAPDGGLFLPSDRDALRIDYKEIVKLDYREMAKKIFNVFLPDYSGALIDEIVEESYRNKFTTDEITPLVSLSGGNILELFHGPTCAFKDVALSVLPNLMTKAADITYFDRDILVLTATSGDTGSAALYGFSGVQGTQIIVFYPTGGISETQRLQMITQTGSNVLACGIKGNFDDAQNGVKALFSKIPDPRPGVSLSSANSINIGRLIPQIVYYFYAYGRLLSRRIINLNDMISFTVPTGNFGDIFAGYLAKLMGLPIDRLICASNRNDVLTEFLLTGHYDRRREFYRTTSPSMDILISSNLERLITLVCGAEKTKEYMRKLSDNGEYTISEEELAEIKKTFVGVSANDADGAEAIGKIFRKESYLMDTHTSIAWACYEKIRESKILSGSAANVVLSTASPYKFSEAVLAALGEKSTGDDRMNIKILNKVTGIDVPEPIKSIFHREKVHNDVIEAREMLDYVLNKIDAYHAR